MNRAKQRKIAKELGALRAVPQHIPEVVGKKARSEKTRAKLTRRILGGGPK